MADEEHLQKSTGDTTGNRPHYAPRNNQQQGPDGSEAVVADNDLAMRGAGAAGASAGAGVPGLGGAPGGTPNSGGVGLPGGNRRLGAGEATTSDAGLGGTTATGGLGTGGNSRSGTGQTPATDVLAGGATRPADGMLRNAQSAPTSAEKTNLERADQGALQTGAVMNDQPGSAAANAIPTHGDEAVTRLRGSRGAQNKPLPPGSDAPVLDAPQYDVNTPTWSAGSRSTPDNPIPEQPTPGLMEHPGPEAET